MPQLNPSPWFLILMSSWVIFLIFLPLKVPSYHYPNEPSLHLNEGLNKPWLWLWS
uniref:ATP synthase complex subunit 8 n=1 Tax=Bokermannohyla alvarengai TaxID=1513809 RepID=A0A343RF62_BOKAL|nr:ATP synthase F0 subunit 8 [Bokermannohyla alvarengai]ATY40979.1 ATP synthase F0 subunit 8 [Bokermannohyla alvarengai]